MKFSLFKNDRSTVKDELVLLVFIVACIAAGAALFAARPAFWVVTQSITMGIGVILILAGVMFIPCLIYRLLTNDKKA